MKYALVTFGCRVNQADSFVLEQQLRVRGATNATPDEADIVVVNTCSVTATADQGARQTIRRIARSNPKAQIVVTGCYGTREPQAVWQLPNVTRVVPNPNKDQLVDLIARDAGLTTAERFGTGDGPCGSPFEPGMAGRTALTVRVQTGCEEQCSYCVIPRTRGACRSKPLCDVLSTLRQAIDAGYKEITVCGVHLGSYGRDLDDGTSLSSLVRALGDWKAEALFRISSLEPMDCAPDIVAAVAESPRLAPHFHLPLQHGCDHVLRRMRRPYTVRFYRELLDAIHSRMPHASIGTDLIVGFPGETAAQFEEMRSLVGELPLTHLHVFPYSDRPGTEAARLAEKVDGRTVRERGRELRALGHEMAARFRQSQVGAVRRALTVDDGWSAVTDNYLKVRLGEQHKRNEWVEVSIHP